MLDEKGFDTWSKSYDASVKQSDENYQYPFAGYEKVLDAIKQEVLRKPKPTILDIGFGTAVLTKQLYDHGCLVYGVDFSKRMLAFAQEKMPEAKLLQADFTEGLPAMLKEQKYDIIISTYAIHHLEDAKKVNFLNDLMQLLKPEGKILLGDVMFAHEDQLLDCKRHAKDAWDEDECYLVVDKLPAFPKTNMNFYPISFCAGILEISKTK